jgi:4-hydroxy-2-oxoheptanedioate aldolase
MGLGERWQAGEAAVGAWCMMPNGFGAEVLAAAGFDYVCIDWQHGILGYDALPPMLTAMMRFPVTRVVRVPENNATVIAKALDAGAQAIIVPLVSSPEEAERAAAACHYPPGGIRSYGPIRPAVLGEDPTATDAATLCLPMIETREGLDAAEEICAVNGVDGIYIGPSDLALSLGLQPFAAFGEREHADAIERVRKACAAKGIAAGIHLYSGAQAVPYITAGFRMVTVAVDAALVALAARNELAAARGG